MAYVTSKAEQVPSGRGMSRSGAVLLVISAVALASGAAASIGNFDPVAWYSASASFDDRFSVGSGPVLHSADIPARFLVRSLPSELDIKFQEAKAQLTRRLQPRDSMAALIEGPVPAEEPKSFEEPRTSKVAGVPLPRSRPVEAARPVEANLELKGSEAENRTLLQKISDLLPARIRLASLAPDGGLFRQKPDLASLGYDSVTAVYDISARAVYLPDGSQLEAHSGFGNLMDNPAYVSQRMVGATPPNVYDLKPREQLFHGVQALRMTPVGDSDTLGRSGLLVHSYMLGPNGDSNGCVSIKEYEKFLKAFSNGDIKRLVVVPNLGDEKSASQSSTSRS
jgi:hypothetical protein